MVIYIYINMCLHMYIVYLYINTYVNICAWRNMWKRAYKIISMQKKTTQKVHDCIIAFMHSCELYISMHLCEIMHMHVDVQNIK